MRRALPIALAGCALGLLPALAGAQHLRPLKPGSVVVLTRGTQGFGRLDLLRRFEGGSFDSHFEYYGWGFGSWLNGGAGVTAGSDGQLYVAREGDPAIVRVDQATRAAKTIAHGPPLDKPAHMAIERDGRIVAADRGRGALIRIDPASGKQAILSSGGLLHQPAGVIVLPDDSLLASDLTGAIVRVNPRSGEQQLVTRDGLLDDPWDLTVGDDGRLYVLDARGAKPTGIVRFDPSTGKQSLVTEGDRLVQAVSFARLENGLLAVADRGASWPTVFTVDPSSGKQEFVKALSPWGDVTPKGIALGPGIKAQMWLWDGLTRDQPKSKLDIQQAEGIWGACLPEQSTRQIPLGVVEIAPIIAATSCSRWRPAITIWLWGSVAPSDFPQQSNARDAGGFTSGVCGGGLDTDFTTPGFEYRMCGDPRNGFSIAPNGPEGSGGGPIESEYIAPKQYYLCCVAKSPVTLTGIRMFIDPKLIGSPKELRWQAVSVWVDNAGCAIRDGADDESQGCQDRIPDGDSFGNASVYLQIKNYSRRSAARATSIENVPAAPMMHRPLDTIGPKVRIVSRRVVVRGGRARIVVRCPKGEYGGCGDVVLRSKLLRATAPRVIAAGKRATLKPRVKPAALRRLRHGQVRARVSVSALDQVANKGVTRRALRLKRRP